jgi:hypothetical protein
LLHVEAIYDLIWIPWHIFKTLKKLFIKNLAPNWDKSMLPLSIHNSRERRAHDPPDIIKLIV